MRMMFHGGGPHGRPHGHPHGRSSEEEEKKKVSWKYVRKFLGLVRPYRRAVVAVMGLMLIGNALGLATPWGVKLIIDHVLTPYASGRLSGADVAHHYLNLIILALLALTVTGVALSATQRYLIMLTSEKLVNDIRRRLHAHIQTLSLRFFEQARTGGILSRLWGDVDSVRSLLFAGYLQCISDMVRVVFILGLLIYLDWRLTVISCVATLLVGIAVLFWSRKVRPRHKQIREDVAQATARTQEAMSGIRIVRIYCRERYENRLFTRNMNDVLRKSVSVHLLQYLLEAAAMLAGGLGMLALLWFGGRQVVAGRLTIGELMAFYSYLVMLFGPIIGIVVINNMVQQAMASVERIFDVLDQKPEMLDKPNASGVADVRGEITFDHVTFSYDEGQPPVLKDVCFVANPGEVVALVGPSGAGKTTITNLVGRFYDPQKGRILLDGRDLRDIRLRDYRSLIGMVPQETFLFDGTIMENIRYGRLTATDDEVREAARHANAHDFIMEFKDGYNSMVGERGVKLSGGQKQRLSIARALLANPKILILDEATSSLDSESEAAIQDALSYLMRGRTTFVIAHRLSTIMHADKIVVLDHGEVKEIGPHAELLAARGLYYRMFTKQFERLRLKSKSGDAVVS